MAKLSDITRGVKAPTDNAELSRVVDYWDTHLNATQFLGDTTLEAGSPEFFAAIEAAYDRFPYKQALFDRIASLPGNKLLEIGCGLGVDLCDFARRGLDVTGIDIAPQAVEMSRRHLAVHGLKGSVCVENCEKLSIENDAFDIVYSSGVIQHTPDIEAAVGEIMRVLRPGGTLIVVLYHKYSWFNLLSKLSGTNVEFADRDAPIIRTFSKRRLRRLFSEAKNLKITMEHYRPKPTIRKGALSFVFNRIFVPCYNAMPERVIRPFGWHAVVTGRSG